MIPNQDEAAAQMELGRLRYRAAQGDVEARAEVARRVAGVPTPTVTNPVPTGDTEVDALVRRFELTDVERDLIASTAVENRLNAVQVLVSKRAAAAAASAPPMFSSSPGQAGGNRETETRSGSFKSGADLYRARHGGA